MSLVLYDRSEPGYHPLDIDALTNEQAIEIASKIHTVMLAYTDIREILPMSLRLSRALNYVYPRIELLKDIIEKPLDEWATHASITPVIYHELRDVVRPFGVRLPPWEMLP